MMVSTTIPVDTHADAVLIHFTSPSLQPKNADRENPRTPGDSNARRLDFTVGVLHALRLGDVWVRALGMYTETLLPRVLPLPDVELSAASSLSLADMTLLPMTRIGEGNRFEENMKKKTCAERVEERKLVCWLRSYPNYDHMAEHSPGFGRVRSLLFPSSCDYEICTGLNDL